MKLRVIERRNFYGEDFFFSPTKGNGKSRRFSILLLAFYIREFPVKCADLGEATEFRVLTCNVEDSIECLASALNK